ncbi:MAG: DNA-directed DNA polymerase [Candidatus Micrarchaeia archaeon]
MKVGKAFLISADYHLVNGKTYVRLLMKGKKLFRLYDYYEPYFYLDAPESESKNILALDLAEGGKKIKVTKVEPVERTVSGKPARLLKVYADYPFNVPAIRKALSGYGAYEYNIPFAKRYLMDKGLEPFSLYTYEREGKFLKRMISHEDKPARLKEMAFDIETYNPQGMPRKDIDPVMMISYACSNGKSGVLTWRNPKAPMPFVKVLAGEKETIQEFCKIVREEDVEMLYGYNSSQFDLPYLEARAKANNIPLKLGRDGGSFKISERGLTVEAKISGRIHMDLFHVVKFLGTIGALKVSKLTLENAYRELVGKESETKSKVQKLEIYKMWDDEDMRTLLFQYSHNDSRETLELAGHILPMEVQLSKITKTPIFDVSSSTTGQLVESLLMFVSVSKGAVIPNKPSDFEVKDRSAHMIQGAFVKLPTPGIYENLVVFDFRGLYPSIICSHNIDPYTLNCTDCKPEECHVSPTGARFCGKKQGLVPFVLDNIVRTRAGLKDQLKKLDKGSPEYADMFARQQALKILANSYYGYLAYARSRWYSRDCGESVTAWGRHYITQTIAKAEAAGFEVLYADTDSVFMLLGSKPNEEAMRFMQNVNSSLPERMELELEAFYTRGVFVTKKAGTSGAKKKYALLDEKGRMKIRGFELVRRDWSKVAKETQSNVLKAILKDGSKDKAVAIVKETVERLRSGTVPLEELVVNTRLNKDPDKYLVTSPELSAARKARAAGIRIDSDAMIGYVITKSGSTVSEKAQVLELAKDYDANYYIEHQILPSVLKILRELGVSEDDLKFKGKQTGLAGFF